MKKILSVALSTAMAFSMFASVAFGQAGLTDVNAQYSYLKDKGIFSGFPDGQAHLDRQMTRAEFAKVITKTLGLKEINGVYSFKDKNYGPKHWAAPFVEAVSAAGIMEGKNTTKKIFDLSGPVSVQEMATVLVRALDLEIPTELNNSASTWAKGYVQAAINAGLVDAKANFQSNADRALLVGAAYAVDQEVTLQVKDSKVIDSTTVEVTMTDGTVLKLPVKELVPNTETVVEFKYLDRDFSTKVTYVVTSATKVDKVSATNLKEILVTFDGTVKEEEAEKITNYKLDDTILNAASSAKIQEDGKSVLISLNTDGPFTLTNQKVHKLTVSNFTGIASASFDFSALDVTVPEVSGVEVLGNKVINVKFSEPVTKASAENRINYKIDGYVANGEIALSKDGRTATITLYSRLSSGSHKISVAGVQDYAKMTIINYLDKELTVLEDVKAPESFTIVSATLDAVTVKFNEAVDQDTVKNTNIYWSDNAGTTKYGSASVSPDDSTFTTYTIEFNTKLPARETTLYVESVSDLFGNSASKLSSVVNATVDTVRPEILSLGAYTDANGNYDTNSSSKFDIKFNKAIDAAQFSPANSNNLVVKNSDGDIVAVANGAVKKANATNTLTVSLSNVLTEGKTYSVAVANVVDTTALSNKIIPQTFTVKVPEVTAPTVTNVAVTDVAEGTKIQVVYSNAMTLDGEYSILKSDRYMIKVGSGASAAWQLLPTGTTFQPTYDSKAVIITIPNDAKINGAVVTAASITGVKATLVADRTGNKLSGLTDEILTGSSKWGAVTANIIDADVKATATNKVKVVFDRPLQVVYASDFLVNGTAATAASYETVNGKGVVTLTVATLNPAVVATLTTKAQADIRSLDVLGNKIETRSSAITIQDGIAPSLVATTPVIATAGDTIEVRFDENLSTSLTPAQVAGNFIIKTGLNQTTVLTPGVDYSAVVSGSKVVITLLTPQSNLQKVTVATNDNAVYIFDEKAYVLGGNSYTNANKIKFAATSVTNVNLIDTEAAAGANAAAKVTAATNAVDTAVATPTQGNVDAAQALINALPEGETKEDLQTRLNVVKGAVQAAKALADAKDAANVKISEASELADEAVVGTDPGEYDAADILTFTKAIATAKTAVTDATTVLAVTNAVGALETATSTFVESAVPSAL